MTIEKSYQPAEVEGRISQMWEAAQAFRAGRPERRAAAPAPDDSVSGNTPRRNAIDVIRIGRKRSSHAFAAAATAL